MAATPITLGQRVSFTATVRPQGGAPADPTAVSLVIRAPDGTTSTVLQNAMTHVPGSGVYTYDHLPPTAGRWWYSWRGATPMPGINAVREVLVVVDDRVVT